MKNNQLIPIETWSKNKLMVYTMNEYLIREKFRNQGINCHHRFIKNDN